MQITINRDHDKSRIDRFLREHFSAPQGLIAGVLRKGKVKVNGKKIDTNCRLNIGDVVTVYYRFEGKNAEVFQATEGQVGQFASWIVFENEDFIAINKPHGVSSQGGVRARLSVDILAKSYNSEARLTHRLDRETSGIMIIAKNKHYARHVTGLFASGLVAKQYCAIATFNPGVNPDGTVITGLEKDVRGQKMVVTQGDDAITYYKIIAHDSQRAKVLVLPKTGKMHQIRVHLASIGMPIFGDKKYGGMPCDRMMLHAVSIEFDDVKLAIEADPTFY